MIIITGPGRSGTSFVAELYRELGFDPGGGWNKWINAGLEASDVVRVNISILSDLGFGTLGPPTEGVQPRYRISRLWKRIAPAQLQKNLLSIWYRLPLTPGRRPGFVRWDCVDDLAAKYRSTLHEIAGSHEVVKDPRFCWTLGVWAAAGVEIEHVLLCTRSLDAMVQSRVTARHYQGRSDASIKDSIAYGLGICITVLYDYRLPHRFIRFPDFLEDPDELYAAFKFPRAVTRDDFLKVVAKLARSDLVHDSR